MIYNRMPVRVLRTFLGITQAAQNTKAKFQYFSKSVIEQDGIICWRVRVNEMKNLGFLFSEFTDLEYLLFDVTVTLYTSVEVTKMLFLL